LIIRLLYFKQVLFQLILGIIGIVGNLIGVVRFSMKSADKNFHQLMRALGRRDGACADQSFHLFPTKVLCRHSNNYNMRFSAHGPLGFGLAFAKIYSNSNDFLNASSAIEENDAY
jgi:hypothetical protein